MKIVIKKNRGRIKAPMWFQGDNFAAFLNPNMVVLASDGRMYPYSYGAIKGGAFHAETRAELKLGIKSFFKENTCELI